MKPTLLFAIAAVALGNPLHAQDVDLDFGLDGKPPVALIVPEEEAADMDIVAPDPSEEAILGAILGGTTEAPEPAEPAPEPAEPAPEPKADSTLPTVVLGAPAEVRSEPGLTVRVEKSPAAQNLGTVTEVKLSSPFPPKPLAAIPAGWILRRPDDTKPFSQVVDLGNGNIVTVSITPFVLAPDDTQPDAKVFSIREPGHKPALQYRQVDTVGALLSKSTQDLEDTDARMTEAIGRLNQLLLSFPKDSQ